jgi:hypothetical protein
LQALAAEDSTEQDPVEVAALIGLQRHAQLGIADKQVEKQVVTELLKLVQQEEPVSDRSVDAHNWMRRRAIEILATLYSAQGSPHNPNEFADALQAIVVNRDNSMMFRAEAASALGRIGTANEKIMKGLGDLVLQITRTDMTRRGYKVYLKHLQTCLTGPDAKGGITPKLPGPQKKVAEELTRLVTGINTRMERLGENNLAVRDQIVVNESLRVEEWLATFLTPEELENMILGTKPQTTAPANTEAAAEPAEADAADAGADADAGAADAAVAAKAAADAAAAKKAAADAAAAAQAAQDAKSGN